MAAALFIEAVYVSRRDADSIRGRIDLQYVQDFGYFVGMMTMTSNTPSEDLADSIPSVALSASNSVTRQ